VRLLLSVGTGPDASLTDVAVDCDDDATVGDLARHLEQTLGAPGAAGSPNVRVRDTGRRLGVVIDSEPGSEPAVVAHPALPAGPAPALYVGLEPVDPGLAVAASPVRNGVVVGLHAPPVAILDEPTGVVEVRVVSGPGAGTVRRLGVGSHRIGPGPECSVRLKDGPTVPVEVDARGEVRLLPPAGGASREVRPPPRSAALDGPIVVPRREGAPGPAVRRRARTSAADGDAPAARFISIDPAEDRASVELDRLPLDTPVVWEPGTSLTVGSSLLDLRRPTEADASLSPSPGGATMDFNRPPRLRPPPRLTEFALPKEPTLPTRQPIPFLVVLAPVAMGAGMYFMTHQVATLLFIALSPLMMIANWWQSRKAQGRRYVEQVAEYASKKAMIEGAAFEALLTEREARRRDVPDPAEVLLQATGPRSRLWERRVTDPDWLVARVGTADLPSEVVLNDPARERHQGALTWTAPDVPVTVALGEAGVTGVAGPEGLSRRVGDWVVAQIAALHSPADLRIVVLTGGDSAEPWAWVRWLPHVRTDGADVLATVGTDDESTARRVAELVAALDARREAAANGGATRFEPVLVVLDGARALRLLPGMVSLLRDGPAYGLTFLCLDADVRLLPEECRVVVSSSHAGLRVESTGRRVVEVVRPDLVSADWCERVARALSPVHDVSTVGPVSSVPAHSRLLAVLGLDPPSADAITRRWAGGGRTTTAVIGEGADGPFAVDLRTDGPHGLIAGTTGSGKSELLQTLIASLAVGNRPDEMNFVLVDYKGGAAFKDCANLPHTVGMVTDLDGHLTTRALESLGAELRRREHLLAAAGAKDIDDYLAARATGDEPMPRLLIVIDEFAALVAELPDFVTGLVDIARRGRSLGVHLVLATQRPAGVVSADIKSNTNLRIALRVTDPGDSQDVVESDVAAHISPSLPGRAYARLGHSQLMPFQSSRVGGRPRGEGPVSVKVRPLTWRTLGASGGVSAPTGAGDDVSTPTDLARLVTAVAAATESSRLERQPSPWLPALPDEVLLADLVGDGGPRLGHLPPLPLGLADLPAQQRQETMTWDFAGGTHLAIAGQTRAGRSSALRLVAAGIARLVAPQDVHVYGLDCGNGALLPLVAMPHVGAVVTRDQPDRVRRLLALLGGEVARRQQLLARGGYADIAEQRAAANADERLPFLVLMLDRWEGFVGAFEQTDGGQMLDQMLTLLREGAAVGLRAVLAGDRSMLTGRMGTALEDRLLLRMPSTDDYSFVGMRQKDVPTRMPPGRAFRSGAVAVEVQLALVAPDPAGTAQVAELQRLAGRARELAGPMPPALRPGRVDDLPVIISLTDAVALREEAARPSELLVGVGGDTLAVRSLDVEQDGPGLLVVGPQRSGRSTVLLAVVLDAAEHGWKVTVVAPRRSRLRDLANQPGIRAVLTADDSPDALRSALDSRGPRLLVIDDFEVLGAEHVLAVVAEEYLKGIRDSGDAIAVGCGVDEVASMYRGVAAVLRKTRTGLLLAPRSAADGDVFSTRLPRSVGSAVPAGRAILVRAGSWEWVQVPWVPATDGQ